VRCPDIFITTDSGTHMRSPDYYCEAHGAPPRSGLYCAP